MVYRSVVPGPGIVKEDTDYASEGRWVDGNNVRFRDGLPENINGWRSKSFVLASQGVPRAILPWQTLGGFRVYSVGTTSRLYIIKGGIRYDITPIRRSVVGATTALTTTIGSSTVTVADTAHGAIEGDTVIFSNASGTVGGLTIDGEYTIVTVPDTNSYTFDAGSNASSNDTGPATIDIDYLINAGNVSSVFGFGWGAGKWNTGTWNSERDTSTVILELGQWGFDTWGEDLVACRKNEKIYLWDASIGTGTRAAVISANAPTTSRFILISRPDRHLFAFGTESTIGNPATQDPLFVRWCAQEDFTDWTPTSENTAGTQRLSGGSKIMAAINTRSEMLIWTDEQLWTNRFIGGAFVFAQSQLGVACGPMGQHAVADVDGVIYWMGSCDFYFYDGLIRVLQCPVHSFVFDNIDTVQGDKVYAGTVRRETEVWWFYQDKSGSENNRVVAYDYVSGDWWIGDIPRTTWMDEGVFKDPIGTGPDGTIYDHEVGFSADGGNLNCYIESGDHDIEEGDQIAFIREVIPDLKIASGTAEIKIKARKYPNATQVEKGPYTITPSTQNIHFRIRGRQISYRIESDRRDASWRLGKPRFDVQPDGGR